MLISIDKKIILEILEESTMERKLTRIPILAATGAVIHPALSSGVEQVFGDGADLSVESLGHKALLGAGIGTLMGGVNYFRDGGGIGPTSQLTQLIYPIKPKIK